jgi:hypothetical protein
MTSLLTRPESFMILFFSGTNVQLNGHTQGARSSEQLLRQDSDSNVIRVPKGPDGSKGFSRR